MRGGRVPPRAAGPLIVFRLLSVLLGLRDRSVAPEAIPYTQAVRQALRDGDVLLFQGGGPLSRVIRWAGRSSYSHAALVYLGRGGRVLVAEAREGLVGSIRLVPLSNALKGALAVDLYRVRHAPAEAGRAVAEFAERYLGQAYGWPTILRMAMAHLPLALLRLLPVVGRFIPRARAWSDNDREPSGRSMVCSEFVARCWREAAGVDLVPRLADRSTEPGDLARSAELAAIGCLYRPDEAESVGP